MNMKKFSAATKGKQQVEEKVTGEKEENKKQEEKLAWLKLRNIELNNTLNGYFFIF